MISSNSSGTCQTSVSATSRMKCSVNNRVPYHRAPHLRKGLFRSTRQTGHSVTAGAQWPWKKTYYPNAAAAAAAATAPAIKTSSTAATFVAAVRWIASSPGDGTEKPPATKTEHMQGMPRITVISHLLRSLTLQLKSAVRCRNYQREMLGTADPPITSNQDNVTERAAKP
ncbi:hypothetical protein LRP88_04348 [Fusarium phalaenopsidis]